MKLWLSKPVYTLLPYFYMLAGVAALGAGIYLDYWYWPLICTLIGLGSFAAGAIVWLKRRDHRSRSPRTATNSLCFNHLTLAKRSCRRVTTA